MKTPLWEPTPGSLVAWLLVNTKARPIDLWTITQKDGTVYRYTGGDVPITVNGTTWVLGPHLQRSAISQRMGVSIDTLKVTVTARDNQTINGVPFLRAVASGALFGAQIALTRVFVDMGGVSRGMVGVFKGNVGDVPTATRLQAQMTVRSFLDVLNVMIPGDIFQAGCRNRLFDARCKLNQATYTVTGVLSSDMDTTRRVITSTSAAVIAKPTNWATLGTLTITSGPNAGFSRPVRLHTLGSGTATITATYPFPFQSLTGQTFSLTAGCDKTLNTCTVKFANKPNFRGEPFIPPPETIL